MKKLLLSLAFLSFSLVSHAEYSATNKTINVVIPNGNPSGLSHVFLIMQSYAEKQNITLTPVYKPGANGKIGIDYAEKAPNNGNTLLLATASDVAQHKATDRFDPVTNINEVKLVLLASKKSNIKNTNDIFKAPPDKFNWAYNSTSQLSLINSIADHYNLEKSKMQLVAYTPNQGAPIQLSLLAGDVDIGYALYSQAKQFIDNDKITLVELDPPLKKRLDSKINSVALFLPKNTNDDARQFWEKFVADFLEDDDTKKKLEIMKSRALPTGKSNLINVLNSWAN